MSWRREKHKRARCTCGLLVSPIGQSRHERGRWHRSHHEAWRLKDLGLSYAEIGRQLGLTRAYVWRRMERAA